MEARTTLMSEAAQWKIGQHELEPKGTTGLFGKRLHSLRKHTACFRLQAHSSASSCWQDLSRRSLSKGSLKQVSHRASGEVHPEWLSKSLSLTIINMSIAVEQSHVARASQALTCPRGCGSSCSQCHSWTSTQSKVHPSRAAGEDISLGPLAL